MLEKIGSEISVLYLVWSFGHGIDFLLDEYSLQVIFKIPVALCSKQQERKGIYFRCRTEF